jgi:two-component system, chemotaxis family, chemotaxis protein CheY
MAKILVVDDSLISRVNLKKILSAEGHEVVGEGTNGLEAVKKFGELKPDLLTLDITMPEMDGLEALQKIVGIHPSAKVIMISALGQNDKIIQAMKSGAKQYITKPYEPNIVISTIKQILN